MGKTARTSVNETKTILSDSNLIAAKKAEMEQLSIAENSFQENSCSQESKEYEGCATPMTVIGTTTDATNDAPTSTSTDVTKPSATTTTAAATAATAATDDVGSTTAGADVTKDFSSIKNQTHGDYIGKVNKSKIIRKVSMLQDMDTFVNMDACKASIAQLDSLNLTCLNKLSIKFNNILNENENAKYNTIGAKVLSERIVEISEVIYRLLKVLVFIHVYLVLVYYYYYYFCFCFFFFFLIVYCSSKCIVIISYIICFNVLQCMFLYFYIYIYCFC